MIIKTFKAAEEKTKQKSLARSIEKYLEDGQEESLTDICDLAEVWVKKAAMAKGISSVVKDDQQTNAALKLLECIFYSCKPGAEAEAVSGKSAKTIRDFIREKLLLKTGDYLNEIDAYLKKCAFSFLKQFADETGKAYMRMNDRIKEALKKLKDDSIIFHIARKYWSASPEPEKQLDCDDENVDKELLMVFAPKKIKDRYYNIASSVRGFLEAPAHKSLAFSTSYLSTLYFSYFEANTGECEFSELLLSHADDKMSTPEQAAILVMANDAIDDFFDNFDLEDSEDLQALMSGLAFMVKNCPEAFADNLLKELPFKKVVDSKGMTDCLSEFLNEIRVSHLNNTKMIKRGTAHNRIRKFLAYYRSAIQDLDSETRGILAAILAENLKELYCELGEKCYETA
jgi:hypothetical protein